MKNILVFATIFGVLFTQTASAATPVVVSSGTPDVRVESWDTEDDFGFCNEMVFTFPIVVSTEATKKMLGVTREVRDSNGNAVMTVEAGSQENIFALNESEFTSESGDVEIPCKAHQRAELWTDDDVIEANTSEDFNVVMYFTPEVAGEYFATLTGIELGDLDDESTTDTSIVYTGGRGACLNCHKKESETEKTPTQVLSAFEALDLDDQEWIDIKIFIELLISLGIL